MGEKGDEESTVRGEMDVRWSGRDFSENSDGHTLHLDSVLDFKGDACKNFVQYPFSPRAHRK